VTVQSTNVEQAASLYRHVPIERRDVNCRLQRDALATHYGIRASDLAGLDPAVVELMAVRLHADWLHDKEQIAEELRNALIRWLFGIGLELQGVAELAVDERVGERLEKCVAELDDCIRYLRQLVFA
jgi:signal transduction histidine kinase